MRCGISGDFTELLIEKLLRNSELLFGHFHGLGKHLTVNLLEAFLNPRVSQEVKSTRSAHPGGNCRLLSVTDELVMYTEFVDGRSENAPGGTPTLPRREIRFWGVPSCLAHIAPPLDCGFNSGIDVF